MALSKIDTNAIADDAVDNTKLDLASNYSFTGTVTGAGEANTPAWNVYKSSLQSLVGDADTLITFDSELVDTDSAFASNKFTVPTGKGGEYFYYANFRHTYGSDRQIKLKLYKNGSMVHQVLGRTNSYGMNFHGIISLSASDYLQLYYVLSENPVSGSIDSGQDNTRFGGFRIKS